MPKGPNEPQRPADGVGKSVIAPQTTVHGGRNASYMPKDRHNGGVAGARAQSENLAAARQSEIKTQAAKVARRKGEKEEKEMPEFCSSALHDLLSGGGRELQNIKFLAGTNPSKEGMCAEAARVIKLAIDRGMPHTPPVTGVAKTKL